MIDDKNICILLKCITTEIGKKKNALFSKYGITGFQSDILAFLYRNIDKDIYQRYIENMFKKSNPVVSGTLDRLEKAGFIYREKSLNDSRYRSIKPTIKALEIGENIRRELDNFYDFKEVLSKEEIKKLEYLLKKMYDYTLKII